MWVQSLTQFLLDAYSEGRVGAVCAVLRTGLEAGSTLGAGSSVSSNMITSVPRLLKATPQHSGCLTPA